MLIYFFFVKTRKLWLIVICILSFVYLNGQTVKVYDEQTGLPIVNVLIFNIKKSATALTNSSGIALLSGFRNTDTLVFQHPSYYGIKVALPQIAKDNFKVRLSENFVDLDMVVVSANKWEQNKSEIPNSIAVIKAKNIAFDNPATSADMLAQSGEVFVQKSQLGGGSPMIRGFAANKILFVLDGVRMNNAIYRSGNLQNVLQADVNSVESAEVIFGPGTNIYGSDALGGVMDIHLKKPVINNSEKWNVKTTLYGRIASAAFEKTLHADINVANNHIAFLSMISYTDFDDLRMGKQGAGNFLRNEYVETIDGKDSIVKNNNPLIQKFSGYHQINFVQKVKLNFNSYTSLNVGAYYSATGKVPRYDRLTQYKNARLKYARWYYSPQSWMMVSAGLDFHKTRKAYDYAKISVAWQQVKEGRNDRKFGSEYLRQRSEKVNITSLNIDFDKKLKNNNSLFYGLEAVYNRVNSTGIEKNIFSEAQKPISSRYPDGGTDYFTGGIYLSYKKDFSKLPLSFSGGIRFSYTGLHSIFIDTLLYHLPFTKINLNNAAITGNLGMVYHPANWSMRFNFSSGFRAPNLDDVAKIFDSEPGNIVVPNENLKPEYLYNVDLGVSYNFNHMAHIEATAFYSLLKDAMVRGNFSLNGSDSIWYDGELSKVQAVVNTLQATIYGFSLATSLQISPHLGASLKYNYLRGYDDAGNALRHVSPNFGSFDLNYEWNKLHLRALVLFNGQINFKHLATSEKAKDWMYAKDDNGNPYSPAWWVMNINGSYAFSDTFLLSLGLENIFDFYYRPYSSGISSPGRNFVLSLKYNF